MFQGKNYAFVKKTEYCKDYDIQDKMTEVSLIESLGDTMDHANQINMKQYESKVLKQNYSSINTVNQSNNNITFGIEPEKRENNLAYAICSRYPPKIRSQVMKIIQYYQNQLEGQRQMSWKMIENTKRKNSALMNNQIQFNENSFVLGESRVMNASMVEKDERISELEQKLHQKDEKILQLNREITTLMGRLAKNTKRKQHSKPEN